MVGKPFQGYDGFILLFPGFSLRSNPVLKLANAFGVTSALLGLKLANAFGVTRAEIGERGVTRLKLANGFDV